MKLLLVCWSLTQNIRKKGVVRTSYTNFYINRGLFVWLVLMLAYLSSISSFAQKREKHVVATGKNIAYLKLFCNLLMLQTWGNDKLKVK